MKAPPIAQELDQSFSQMSISGRNAGCPKMIAVVDDDSPPHPCIHSEWKDHDRQMRFSLAINLPSGSTAADVTPTITSDGTKIGLSKKWPKSLFALNKVLTKQFLLDLHKAENTPDPRSLMDEDDDDGYPFHQVSIAQGLVKCIHSLQLKKRDDDNDTRPSIVYTLDAPFALDHLFLRREWPPDQQLRALWS